MYDLIAAQDAQLAEAMRREYDRQRDKLELIASENFASPAVLEAAGSVLTNKYAEGYPGKRYYGGCEHVDEVEQLAIDRAKELFGADHANVQPHSGSTANMIAYFAVLEVGDVVMGMDLAHGGHLTHGLKVNFSGRFFNFVSYGVSPDTETIDYDALEKSAKEVRPRLIVAGHSAYPRQLDFERLRAIADATDAMLMVDMAHFAGLVAADEHPSPVPYADIVTSTTHKTLRGPRSGFILCRAPYAKAIDKSAFPGAQGGPLMHIIAAKAVAFGEAATPGFKAYARQVRRNAAALGAALTAEGLRMVSGGTENHLLLVDLTPYGISGKQAETALDAAAITCNKNMIPFDQRKPTEASGIRLGVPAVTTRGMNEEDMRRIGGWIARILRAPEDKQLQRQVSEEVHAFTAGFPLHVSVHEQVGAGV
ncbi:MAG TPA: serine hydroxymethyltransferase [Candidatus Sumerlaeota bacterium]|nr:MAG: Serine hydroxymethyltransferase [candidate division BRC1 bacterium ADurb.BinA292]HOE96063.1 serine hydroxymethyltransferase [Candidatus Sumerlaeota bacterium]HPK01844.1 serine hydroxymethyltransferase [Candidatus Sumerlaeota bacterium]